MISTGRTDTNSLAFHAHGKVALGVATEPADEDPLKREALLL